MLASPARVLDLDPIQREPAYAIHVPADPNGLAFDRGTLYVTDGDTGAVLAVEQGRRRQTAAITHSAQIAPVGVAGHQLGGIAVGPDGALFVVRLGHGEGGAIFRVERARDRGNDRRADLRAETATVTPLAGLCPRAWRLGVAYDAGEHAVYATQYGKRASGPCDGAIVRVDLATGAVTTAVTGLVKPVGVAKLGDTLVISDGKRRTLSCVTVVGGRGVARRELAAFVERPDALAACGADSVVVATFEAQTQLGRVRRLWLDGRSRLIACGAWEPRGIATDGARVFVSARRANAVLAFSV